MKKCLAGLAVFVVLLASSISAQVVDSSAFISENAFQDILSFDFSGGGARAQAMGNAYIAISDDITAGSWNPAGLINLDRPVLGLSYSALSPGGYSDFTAPSGAFRKDHLSSVSALSTLNFAAPFRIKGRQFVGSINYNASSVDIMDWGFRDTVTAQIFTIRKGIGQMEDFVVDQTLNLESQSTVAVVSFSFGTRLSSKMTSGLGVNVYTGSGVSETSYLYSVEDFPIFPSEQEVVRSVDFTEIDSIQYSGINFTLGMKYEHDKLSAGLTLKSPFDLKVKYDVSRYTIVGQNGFPVGEGTDTTYIDDNLTKYGMPLMIGFGLGYQLQENVLVAGAAEYRGFSGAKVKFRESFRLDQSGQTTETFTERDSKWENVIAFRFGGEYTRQTDIGKVPIRGGVAFVPVPIPNTDGTATRTDLSVGTGIHWGQIMLDGAYTYSTLDRDFEQELLDAKIRNHHFAVTFTGYF